MIVADEWVRSPAWGPEDQVEFERRLARARRTSRPQYLRIKGLAINAAGHRDAARSLWLRVLEDPDDRIQRWATLEHLGDLDLYDDPTEAEARYRQLLVEDPTLNGTTQMVEVRLAELLTRRRTPDALTEAGQFLEAWATTRRSPFPVSHFEWELARAKWAEAIGNPELVREAASRALALAEQGAPFPRHPGVGVVHAPAEVMKWLRSKAG